jgi:hypothetical protein
MTPRKILLNILIFACACASFGADCNPPNVNVNNLGKGYFIFDVGHAITHLSDVTEWRKLNNFFSRIPQPNIDPVNPLPGLVTFLKSSTSPDRPAQWVAIKCGNGQVILDQFADIQQECCNQQFPLIGWYKLTCINDADAEFQARQAKSLFDQTTVPLSCILFMPSDEFYDSPGSISAATNFLTAFATNNKYRFIYAPQQWDTAGPDSSAQVQQRAQIHDLFYDNANCLAISPRNYWGKALVPSATVGNPTGQYVTNEKDYWSDDSPQWLKRKKKLNLILMGQVQQEFCNSNQPDPINCPCGYYGDASGCPPPGSRSDANEVNQQCLPCEESGVGYYFGLANQKNPQGMKTFKSVGITFWDFEDMNPMEHAEFLMNDL